MKFLFPALVMSMIVLLVFASGCTSDILTKAGVGNFGGTPSPTTAISSGKTAGSVEEEYAGCMRTCKQIGVNDTQCTRSCCVGGCSEDSPGGVSGCFEKCMYGSLPVSPKSSGTQLPATTLTYGGITPASGTTSSFTCEYDETLIKTSTEFRTFFNSSCYYNEHCGWWESTDLLPKTTGTVTQCINCTVMESGFGAPTPTLTPCPVRSQKPDPIATTVFTTPAASTGTCGSDLTQCRVFSTDYCVDLMTDVSHCGACRWHCPLPNAVNGCSGGKCYVKSCLVGWGNCNGNDEDGCEVSLNADDNNCGKCGRVCSLPNSHAICAGENGDGRCEVEYCTDGYMNTNGIHEDGCEDLFSK